jgi:hypothetical protein
MPEKQSECYVPYTKFAKQINFIGCEIVKGQVGSRPGRPEFMDAAHVGVIAFLDIVDVQGAG